MAGTFGGPTAFSARDFGSDTTRQEPEHEATRNEPAGAADAQRQSTLAERAQDSQQQPQSKPRSGLRYRLARLTGKGNAKEPVDTTEEKKESKWRKGGHIPVGQQLRAVLFGSWINLLLLTVPAGFALNYAHLNGVVIFVINFIAIIPLASTLSFATEELALYVGQTMGGLLNATFGNATELIVCIIALTQKKILIVQTSLIGSMLSNLLLVLGMCFFFGGLTRMRQYFNITVAQTASSLLALSIGSLIVPTAFVRFGSNTDSGRAKSGVAPISRGTSVILLLVYASYLLFQLRTHTEMYNEPSKKGQMRPNGRKEKGDAFRNMARIGAAHAGTTGGSQQDVQEIDDEEEQPSLSVMGALVTLAISTVLIAFCSEFMVTGIDAIAGHISQEFIGLILIPIVGNAAEHATAVTVAIKDKMDLAIGVAVGSSMQIALLVVPLMVIIGWFGVGKGPDPNDIMDLDFDGFQVAVLFIAVLLVNYLIQDGESHWLEGVLLIATYIIIAVTAFFYPVSGDVAG